MEETENQTEQKTAPKETTSAAESAKEDYISASDSEGTGSFREHSDEDSEGSVGIERESGDGQESVPTKKVDDDEDKKNPQYIPKRGTFYEHDDRTVEDDEEVAAPEPEKDQKKKVWQDKKERWGHDRFSTSEQAPKSKAELIAIYGYDIRNEEGPPRARRRRRYGRGPNKYTRNWEDEDAYNKPAPARTKTIVSRRTGRSQDSPPIENESNLEPVIDKPIEIKETTPNVTQNNKYSELPSSSDNRNQQRVGSGRVIKAKPREIKDSDYRGFTAKTRQVRNMKTEQKIVPKNQRRDDVIHTQNFTNKNNVTELENEVSKLNIHEGGSKRQGSVPPRHQTEQKNSKRYSSIRQRSLPESATPPFSQPSYYNEFNQSQVIHPSSAQIAPAPIQVPVTAAPILPPPQFPPFPQPPFMPPAPTFIPQQTPILNYVAQPQFALPGFQQQFNQSQPEMFNPQTGITYYSTDQQVAQRAVLKRPKAAIPIVAPPPIDLKGKIREDDVSSYEGDISGLSEAGDSAQETPIQVQQ